MGGRRRGRPRRLGRHSDGERATQLDGRLRGRLLGITGPCPGSSNRQDPSLEAAPESEQRFPPTPQGGELEEDSLLLSSPTKRGGRVLEGLDDREGIEHGRVLLLIKSFLFFVRVSFLIEEEGGEEEEERC